MDLGHGMERRISIAGGLSERKIRTHLIFHNNKYTHIDIT